MAEAIILFFMGLIALWGGAKWLVQGASQWAAFYRIPSLIVGLTLVAFGTSSPEVGVTLVGAWRGQGALVVGNIIGSNIFNLLFILGLCAVIKPLLVKRRLIRWDVPLMIVSVLLFWLLSSSGTLGHLAGALLLGGLLLYILLAVFIAKNEPVTGAMLSPPTSLWKPLFSILAGLALLAFGSDLFITGATKIAHTFGVSELLIGLTLVASGTSLPELATSLYALRKGENDIAVGNIVGSGIFNLLGVMGIGALLSPHAIEIPSKALFFDIPIMLAITLAALPIFFTGHRISRWEGFLFLFYYLVYLIFLFLDSTFPHYPLYFTSALFFFIIPLTLLTLVVGVVRHFGKQL